MLVTALAALCLTTASSNAYGPYHFCYADGSTYALSPGESCNGGDYGLIQSAHARVDTGTSGWICVRIYSSGGTLITGTDCAGPGTGSTVAVTYGGCATGHGKLWSQSSSPSGFHGHGWLYTYSGCSNGNPIP